METFVPPRSYRMKLQHMQVVALTALVCLTSAQHGGYSSISGQRRAHGLTIRGPGYRGSRVPKGVPAILVHRQTIVSRGSPSTIRGASTHGAARPVSGFGTGRPTGFSTAQSTGFGSGQSTSFASGQSIGFVSGQSTGFGSGQSTGFGAERTTGFGAGQSTGFGSGQSTGFGAEQSTGFGTGQSTGFGTGQSTGFG